MTDLDGHALASVVVPAHSDGRGLRDDLAAPLGATPWVRCGAREDVRPDVTTWLRDESSRA